MNLFKCIFVILSIQISVFGQELEVTEIKVSHKNGQTFITWKDVAEGEEGSKYTYAVYRSQSAITEENKDKPYMTGVLNNSGILFGGAFNVKNRASSTTPMTIFEENGTPLPNWSGLAVVTVDKIAKSFYAVVAFDSTNVAVTKIAPGKSATTVALDEEVKPIMPMKIYDSKNRGQYSKQTTITGTENLPLYFELHASNAQGGGAGGYGDYYLYFSRPEWGYRDGLPGVFSILEKKADWGVNALIVSNRETIEHPSGKSGFETYWFGYVAVPQWAEVKEPRAYPFTERRALWILEYCISNYKANRNQIYAGGGSMGAWGSLSFAFRQKNVFAAVYPNRPRTIQKGCPSLVPLKKDQKVLLEDGETDYFERMNTVIFAAKEKGDLPFLGWCCGRRDGFATWKEQIDLVESMKKSRHGFAFAWNDGDHSSGAAPMGEIFKYYNPKRFALNVSYPAFSNSSIDNNMGNGDPKDGDMVGGINLGFKWVDPVETATSWSLEFGNELCKETMTVDITPRRCQVFKIEANQEYKWNTSDGGTGKMKADADGLLTIEKLKIEVGKNTKLTIEK